MRPPLNLADFIWTGKLGPIALGLTRHECVEMLGEPEGQGRPSRRSKCWLSKYGILELTFLPDGLGMIQVEKACEVYQDERWQGFVDTGGVPVLRQPLLDWVRAQGLTWTINPSLTFDDQECVQVSSGVFLMLQNDELVTVYVSSL